MRNQRVLNNDDHHTDEQCSCCGGWFDHHDTIEVTAEPPDVAHTGRRDNLEICEHCINYEISDGFADTIRDSNDVPAVLPRVEFDALTEECKRNRIVAFIPAREQINSEQDVREFFAALTQYLVWHPETDFADYAYQAAGEPLKEGECGKPIFDAKDAERLNECMARAFEVCERITKHTVDPYEIAFEEQAKANEGMAAVMGRDHKTGKFIPEELREPVEKLNASMDRLSNSVGKKVAELKELREQRDDLLAALKDIAESSENPQAVNVEMASFPDRVSRIARAAIARAEKDGV